MKRKINIKNIVIILSFIFLALILTGCGKKEVKQEKSTIELVEGFSKHVKNSYEVQIPKVFEIIGETERYVNLILDFKAVKKNNEILETEINLVREKITVDISIEEYVDLAVEKLEKEIEITDFIKEKIEKNGREGYKIGFTNSSKADGQKEYGEQYVFMKDNYAYLIVIVEYGNKTAVGESIVNNFLIY